MSTHKTHALITMEQYNRLQELETLLHEQEIELTQLQSEFATIDQENKKLEAENARLRGLRNENEVIKATRLSIREENGNDVHGWFITAEEYEELIRLQESYKKLSSQFFKLKKLDENVKAEINRLKYCKRLMNSHLNTEEEKNSYDFRIKELESLYK